MESPRTVLRRSGFHCSNRDPFGASSDSLETHPARRDAGRTTGPRKPILLPLAYTVKREQRPTVRLSSVLSGHAFDLIESGFCEATFLLPVELMGELRAASVNVPPRVFGSTLSALVARGVQSELAKLRRDWNDGKPFKRSGPIQTRKGRPPKA